MEGVVGFITGGWGKLIGIVLIVLAIAGSYGYAYHEGVEHQKGVQAVEIAKVNAAAKIKYDGIAKELEAQKGYSLIVYRDIIKKVPTIVDRPVYSNVCLDSDGVNLINQALRGTK